MIHKRVKLLNPGGRYHIETVCRWRIVYYFLEKKSMKNLHLYLYHKNYKNKTT